MQIIGKHLIEAAQKKHSNWKGSLGSWVRIVEGVAPPGSNLPAVRRTRKDADPVGDCVVFDIKNNEARLISNIHYKMGTVTVLAVLTTRSTTKEGGKVPATAERLPAKDLSKKRLLRPFLRPSNTKPTFPAFSSCNAKRIAVQKKQKLPNYS